MQRRTITPANTVTICFACVCSDPQVADGDQAFPRVKQWNPLPHPRNDTVFLQQFLEFVGASSSDRAELLATLSKSQCKATLDRIAVDAAIDTRLQAHLPTSDT